MAKPFQPIPASKWRPSPQDVEDDEEIDSSEEFSAMDSEIDIDSVNSESGMDVENVKGRSSKGYNKYGTEDPILAAAEEALDNGLFDSEGNIDEEGFEGLFGTKFSESGDEYASENEGSQTKSEEIHEYDEVSQNEPDFQENQPKSMEIIQDEVTKPAPEDNELLALVRKKVKGLLNRLSIGNFETIATSLEALYNEHPRRLVTEAICDLVIDAVTLQSNMLESFVLVFASLTATLAHILGVPFVGHFLQLISTGLDAAQKATISSASEEGRMTEARKTMNLITLLAFLYDLQIVGSQLIGDLVRCSVERLSELDTEIVLRLTRLCGAQFRRDDPGMLKDIVLALGKRTQDLPAEAQSSRFRFMLEAIYDLKNNKQLKGAGLPSGELETTKKMLRGLVQARGISKFEPLRLGLADLREADRRGRWWLVGGTWAPEASSERHSEHRQASSTAPTNSLEELARTQRMNTDVRKRIFTALLASEDCVDAQQRLLALRLNSKQERDIPAVILQCVGQERAYNPFYALLALRLIRLRHNHVVTFRHAFWDWLEQIESAPLRRVAHLATFFASLVGQQAISLPGLLRRADLLHLGPQAALFFQLLLVRVLQDASEATLHAIFASFTVSAKKEKAKGDADQISLSEESQAMRSSLKLFLVFYIRDKPLAELPPLVKAHDILVSRINLVSGYLG